MNSQFDYLKDLLDRLNNFFLIVIDMEGRYSYTNGAFEKKFCYLSDSFIGRHCMEDVHPEDRQHVIDTVKFCLENIGQFHSITIRKPINDQDYITSDWDFIAMADQNNVPQGIMCIGYEITHLLNSIDGKRKKINEMINVQSHIIRKPLANILGLVGLIDQHSLTAHNVKIIEYLKASAVELDNALMQMAKNSEK